MSEKDVNKLKEHAEKIRHKYEDLLREIDSMEGTSHTSESRIRGVISSAAVTAESLLKYIIRNEGRENKLNELKSNERGLFMFKKIVEDLIPENQKVHLGTIIPWRNIANHHSDHATITENELKAVETAINSLVKWFFEEYLKGDYADYSKNLYAKKKEGSQRTTSSVRKEHINNPVSIPETTNLKRSDKNNKKKWYVIGLVVIVTTVLTTCFILIYKAKMKSALQGTFAKTRSEKPASPIQAKEINRDTALVLIQKYMNLCTGKSDNFNEVFADKISNFFSITPVTLEKVISYILNRKHVYENTDYHPDPNSLTKTNLSRGMTTFVVTAQYKKKKGKKRKSESELLEFTFDKNGKITSVLIKIN